MYSYFYVNEKGHLIHVISCPVVLVYQDEKGELFFMVE